MEKTQEREERVLSAIKSAAKSANQEATCGEGNKKNDGLKKEKRTCGKRKLACVAVVREHIEVARENVSKLSERTC